MIEADISHYSTVVERIPCLSFNLLLLLQVLNARSARGSKLNNAHAKHLR